MAHQSLISRKFKGIFIPAEIWLDKSLTIQEKSLWAEIESLDDDEKGGCWASDEYLMEFMGVKRAMLQRYLQRLKEKNYLITVNYDGRQVIRKAVNPHVSRHQMSNDSRHQMSTIVDITSLRSYTSPTKKKDPSHINTKNKAYNKDSCSDGSSNASKPHVSFSFEQGFLGITPELKQVWKDAYPDIDIESEIAKARAWCIANERKAKLKKQWIQFLTKWFSKASDSKEWKSVSKAVQGSNNNRDEISLNKQKNADSVAKSYDLWIKEGVIKVYDNRVDVKIGKGWIPISFHEYGFDEQVSNALRKGGHQM